MGDGDFIKMWMERYFIFLLKFESIFRLVFYFNDSFFILI